MESHFSDGACSRCSECDTSAGESDRQRSATSTGPNEASDELTAFVRRRIRGERRSRSVRTVPGGSIESNRRRH